MNTTALTLDRARREGNVIERPFRLGQIPGVLWTPASSDPATPVPLVLAGQPGGLGLDQMRPRLLARAQAAAASGMATATLEMPGTGGREPLSSIDVARGELRAAIQAGHPVPADVINRLVLPLVDLAVPEWQELITALGADPGPGPGPEALPRFGAVGFSGGLASIGVRLAALEPRVRAAVLFAGSFLPRAIIEEAADVRIPMHVLLQWDDEGNDRAASLELFDALGSAEKTLTANLGGHRGVPAHAGDAANAFLLRHLLAA